MAEPTAIPAPARSPRLLNNAFGVETFKFNRWSAVLSETQTLDDAMRPEFWAEQSTTIMGPNAADPRGVMDVLVVRKPDTGDYWELVIREIGKGFIKVQLKADCKPVAVDVPDAGFTTKWQVGKRCHEVVRKDTGAVMSTGHQSKAAAVAWINDHLKAMAA